MLYRFVILLYLISSFSLTRSLLVPYAHVSIESILLSFFELKAILLLFAIKTLFLSLINFCHVFNINLLFFYEFFIIFFQTMSFYFLLIIMYFIIKLSYLYTVFTIFKFKFPFDDTFLCILLFYLHYQHLISNYTFLLLIQKKEFYHYSFT